MTAPLSPKQLAAYERSNDGMIAANIEMETICGPGGGSVWLWGKEANSRVVLSGNEIQPGVAIVSPGTYFPYHATCWGYNFTADLPNVDSWFLPFRVEAQTIVHLGTFTASAVNVEVDRSDLNVAAAAVVTFGLSLLINGPTETVQFPVYEFQPASKELHDNLRQVVGGFGDQIVERLPVRILSPVAMEAAYRRAYAPKSDGSAPSREEAEARLKSEIGVAIKESLEEYVKPLKDGLPDVRAPKARQSQFGPEPTGSTDQP